MYCGLYKGADVSNEIDLLFPTLGRTVHNSNFIFGNIEIPITFGNTTVVFPYKQEDKFTQGMSGAAAAVAF